MEEIELGQLCGIARTDAYCFWPGRNLKATGASLGMTQSLRLRAFTISGEKLKTIRRKRLHRPCLKAKLSSSKSIWTIQTTLWGSRIIC